MLKGQGPRFGRKPEAADRAGWPGRRALAAALVCFCPFALPSPVSAQGDVGGSTVTARVRQDGSPLILTLARDRRDSRISVDYSVRWDFSDLASFRPGLKMLSAGLSALWKWDITENTRVRYYGVRTNPWRLFLSREKAPGVYPASGGTSMTAPGAGPPEYRRRFRLSLSPLVDDLKRDLDEDLRYALLKNSLRSTGPEWGRLSARDRKVFVRDVLSLDIWDLPVLDTTKKGLEYISK